jgi:hypothetical protein
VLSACEDDQVDQTAELVGRWEVIHAFRDQVPTESLTGLYYDFSAAGQLQTNMTGTEESYVYTLEDRQLAQREGGLDADYEVDKLSTDTLILRTELRRKKFRIILQRINSATPDSIVPAAETE